MAEQNKIVAEKWLKDRKGRALSPDDLRHYQRIVLALVRTDSIMHGLSSRFVNT